MQQKSHEILSAKCGSPGGGSGAAAGAGAEAEGSERQTRRLLAAAEEALSQDWAARPDHHHHHHHHHLDLTVRLISCLYVICGTGAIVTPDGEPLPPLIDI